MGPSVLLHLAVLAGLAGVTVSQFSCAGGPQTCPDEGAQRAAGNVTVRIMEAKNLPDTDGFGLAAWLPDPYLKVRARRVCFYTL